MPIEPESDQPRPYMLRRIGRWLARLAGLVLIGLVMLVGLLEMTKSPEQQQRELRRVMFKLQCGELRRGIVPTGVVDAEGRRRLEEECRAAGLPR
jgi:hypothetical protein